MRELQATQLLLNKVLAQLRNLQRAKDVYVVIGEIAEIEQGLIQTHWQTLCQNTPAEQAQLHFRLIKAEVQCMACFSKYNPIDAKIYCPHCGIYGAKVLSGEEFYLENIELFDN